MQIKYISNWEIIIFFISLGIFGSILHFNIITDIQLHVLALEKMANGTIAPSANFLYFLTVYTVAFFNSNPVQLCIAAVFVLAVSVTAKFTLTRAFATEYYRLSLKDDSAFTSASDTIIIVASLLLLIIQCLPSVDYYISGQIPPNVWHNSTVIFVMPFALSLFWLSYKQLDLPNTNRIFIISLLCILNVLIKPSYLFVFIVAYPLMLFKRFGLVNTFWVNLLPILVTAVSIIGMYYLIYHFSFDVKREDQSEIVINAFSVWSHYSSNILLSLVCSLAFPITYLSMYPTDIIKNSILQYSVLSYVIAIVIAVLLSETGAREFHGNFFWQAIICSYILFQVTTMLFLEKLTTIGIKNWKNTVISIAFLLHVISGIVYLGKLFYYKDYS